MSAIDDAARRLRVRQKELKLEFEKIVREGTRIEKALKALENLSPDKHIRMKPAKGVKVKCAHCGEEFTAKRSDAKYCKLEHYPSYIAAHNKKAKVSGNGSPKGSTHGGKPVTLFKGDALSQR